jgi:hypothetical protein
LLGHGLALAGHNALHFRHGNAELQGKAALRNAGQAEPEYLLIPVDQLDHVGFDVVAHLRPPRLLSRFQPRIHITKGSESARLMDGKLRAQLRAAPI